MKTIEEKIEIIADMIDDLDLNEIIEIHNNYCLFTNQKYNSIYQMEELDDVLQDYSATEILELDTEEFNTIDDYFYLPVSSMIISTNEIFDIVDTYKLASYIVCENDSIINDTDIEDLLEE